MGEGAEGEEDEIRGVMLAANSALAALNDRQQNRLAFDLAHLRWLGNSIEADFRYIRRQKWRVRGLVFWNIAAGCWCLASWPRWVAWLAVVSIYGAWKGFRVVEGWADDEKRLGARWAEVREQMKKIERFANHES